MLVTAMPTWATDGFIESQTNVSQGSVKGYGRCEASRRGHGRHISGGSGAAHRARGGRFLGDLVRTVPHGGADHGPARRQVQWQGEDREGGRGRQSGYGDAL